MVNVTSCNLQPFISFSTVPTYFLHCVFYLLSVPQKAIKPQISNKIVYVRLWYRPGCLSMNSQTASTDEVSSSARSAGLSCTLASDLNASSAISLSSVDTQSSSKPAKQNLQLLLHTSCTVLSLSES